jgi:NADPH:quinone reductase-like Zn-dependent oxidoreductase
MQAVRAARLGGPEVLELVEIERPEPLSTEVLVAVRAAGLNPVDFKTRGGSGVSGSIGPPPFVLGWDVAGVVEDLGYGVTRFRPGDRVLGMPWFPREARGYSQYVAAPSLQFALLPEGMSYEDGAGLPLAGLTAWQSLSGAGAAAGARVLVLAAAGGVGHLAVQIAKARGAHVIASGSPRNHEFLRELGADEVVDRGELPASSVDVVLDLVGGDSTRASLAALHSGGVMVAVADGADSSTTEEASSLGVRVIEPLVEPDGRTLDELVQLVSAGRLRVVVQRVFALEAAAAAHALLERGGARGKLVLSVPA